jgi:hypothetical protein
MSLRPSSVSLRTVPVAFNRGSYSGRCSINWGLGALWNRRLLFIHPARSIIVFLFDGQYQRECILVAVKNILLDIVNRDGNFILAFALDDKHVDVLGSADGSHGRALGLADRLDRSSDGINRVGDKSLAL